MKNIILTGMPASGKSTIGVILAKTIGYDFIDTDLIIQKMTGKRLQEIIDSNGLEEFLFLENKALLSVENTEKTVISVGGSACFSIDGMDFLRENGTIIYLKTELTVIKERLFNIKTRGIAASKNKSIEDIFAEREPLYLKYADIVIDCTENSVEKTVEKILQNI